MFVHGVCTQESVFMVLFVKKSFFVSSASLCSYVVFFSMYMFSCVFYCDESLTKSNLERKHL